MQTRDTSTLLPFTEWSLDKENYTLALDAVLPEQMSADPASVRTRGPEADLMRAILEDAIICFQHQFYDSPQRSYRLAREAEAWFFSDDTHWPFAFMNICEVLGFNPAYIRRGLRYWSEKHPVKLAQRRRRVVGTRGVLKLAA